MSGKDFLFLPFLFENKETLLPHKLTNSLGNKNHEKLSKKVKRWTKYIK